MLTAWLTWNVVVSPGRTVSSSKGMDASSWALRFMSDREPSPFRRMFPVFCTPTTNVTPRSPCSFMQALVISSPAMWGPGTSITTATPACRTTTAANCPPPSPLGDVSPSGGASTIRPATWWPGMASGGTVIVNGTLTSSSGSSLNSVSERESHCLVPRLLPSASWPLPANAVPALTAVMPSAAYSFRLTGTSPVLRTSTASDRTAPGSSWWEK